MITKGKLPFVLDRHLQRIVEHKRGVLVNVQQLCGRIALYDELMGPTGSGIRNLKTQLLLNGG